MDTEQFNINTLPFGVLTLLCLILWSGDLDFVSCSLHQTTAFVRDPAWTGALQPSNKKKCGPPPAVPEQLQSHYCKAADVTSRDGFCRCVWE